MKPFIYQRGDQGTWAEGSLLHVYVAVDLASQPDLAMLVHGCRAALAGWPIGWVADEWLHITLDQITDRPAAEIDLDERAALAEALTARLADIPPLDLLVGSPLAYPSGVIADLHPDGPLLALHEAVRETIRAVRGPDAVRYPAGVQHLTIGYAQSEASTDDAARLLRRVRPSHAPLRVDRVELVDVVNDPVAKTITWQRLAVVSLGGSPAPLPPAGY